MRLPWHGHSIVTLLLALVVLAGLSLPRAPASMVWRYKVEKMGSDANLAGTGMQGWEIVAARWVGDDYELILRKGV